VPTSFARAVITVDRPEASTTATAAAWLNDLRLALVIETRTQMASGAADSRITLLCFVGARAAQRKSA
jgi:hypothetical protein